MSAEETDFSSWADPATWSVQLLQNPGWKRGIVLQGPIQLKRLQYPLRDKRRFNQSYFYKTLDIEHVTRDWLVYSDSTNSLHCFACLLFQEHSRGSGGDQHQPWKNIGSNGYTNFGQLGRGIRDHEKTNSHFACMIRWKQYKQLCQHGKTIDAESQRLQAKEISYWKSVLTSIVDAIIFLARNNLAFRGASDIIMDDNCGNFLSLIKLLSRYHPPLAVHVDRLSKNQTSYLSNKIQNEFISLLGNTVKTKILDDIRHRKYFSIMFDATPDCSHKEQISQVIRTVKVTPEGCSIEENFIDFIHFEGKSGEQLANMIVEKLKNDGLDLNDCRGQGYDNGANMAGAYRGVQSRIRMLNRFANFVPCAAHSLNLVGQNAVTAVLPGKLLLGQIQSVFNFFSAATIRWNILKKHVKRTVKSQSSTRWSSKADAVSVLSKEYKGVLSALKEMKTSKFVNAQTMAEANLIYKMIFNFKFIVGIRTWDCILQKIDRVNKCLQEKSTDIDRAGNLIEGLSDWLRAQEPEIFDNAWNESVSVAQDLNISVDSGFAKRISKKPVRYRSKATAKEQVQLNNKDQFCNTFYRPIMTRLISEYSKRFKALTEINSDFDFLWGSKLANLHPNQLRERTVNLSSKYPGDYNEEEFIAEIVYLKFAIQPFCKDSVDTLTALDVLNVLTLHSLHSQFVNCHKALRIFLTFPVTVATNERAFSKLKIIKNYRRSTMGQNRLTSLAILSVECKYIEHVSFDGVIETFCATKCRRMPINT